MDAVRTNFAHTAALLLAPVLLFAALASAKERGGAAPARESAGLARLTLRGTQFVDPEGKAVILRGVNLGNWLVLETWMLQWDTVEDQHTVVRTLRERFGAERADGLMELYRDSFITERDFAMIKSLGFNLVRLPLGWDTLQSASAPFAIGGPGYRHIDRAIEMAGRHGIYVVLDLHGAPGGQSDQHHTLRQGQNRLWSDQENFRRTAEIWTALARRYKDSDAVIAYDLLNEPYGDFKQDLRGPLLELTGRLYDAIRRPESEGGAGDPETLILLPAFRDNEIEFYGDPRSRGWKNVGFTDHYYAGLFGDLPQVSSHARLIKAGIARRKSYLDHLEAPFLVGEFNVVLDEAGGTAMMRHYFDLFAGNGWMSTMWSYKLLKSAPGVVGASNWYVVTNAEALAKLDVRTASLGEVESYMRSLATMELSVYEKLDRDLRASVAPRVDFGAQSDFPTQAPDGPRPLGWTLHRIGQPVLSAGVVADEAMRRASFVAAGGDIWHASDNFDYFARGLPSGDADFEVEVTLESMVDSDRWAKTGIMLRRGLKPESGHAMIHVIPSGAVAISGRSADGAAMQESTGEPGSFPITLRLVRKGGEVRGFYRRGAGSAGGSGGAGEEDSKTGAASETSMWIDAGVVAVPDGRSSLHIGLAACSHSSELRTRVVFSHWRLK
jgi:endoglucanase